MTNQRPCHWCFKTTRPFEPGMMIVNKGKHEQIACGVPLRNPENCCIEINFVRGIWALDKVDCPLCRASLAFKQTERRMHENALNVSIRGYQVVVTREVKSYGEACNLALQAKRRGWKAELHEVVRPTPTIRRHKLWSSAEGRPPT